MRTMADVAEKAGVSVATVSRALSGNGSRVRPAVLERVLATAEELGYHPNYLGRNMRAGTAKILGLVISDVSNPFFTAIARGCEDVAQRHGYSLVLANTDESPAREVSILGVLAAERVAGIAIASTNEINALRKVVAVGIPIVAIDRHIDGLETDEVVVDNETAAYEAVTYLVRLGHRRIAMVAGPAHISSVSERLSGYERALRDHGIQARAELVRRGNLRESGGYEVATAFLDEHEQPTAIFSANNLMTVGVLRAIKDRGIRIPWDLSLVGFDDVPIGDLLDPPLTVVQQPTYQLGARAGGLLIKRTESPRSPIQHLLLAAKLVVRGSTAPVSASG